VLAGTIGLLKVRMENRRINILSSGIRAHVEESCVVN
jgi:hypothetical protein